MLPQRPLPFFLTETIERFESRIRDAELLEQQAAQLLNQQAAPVQQERNRREAEDLRGRARDLRSFEGQRRLIETFREEEMLRILHEGALVYRWGPFHNPAGRCWFEKCVMRWSDGRIFVCILTQDEIWERIIRKKLVPGMDGHMYESDVTESVFTGRLRQRMLNSVTEGLSRLTPEELNEIEPYL